MIGATETICNHTFLARLINSNSVVLDLGANYGEFSHGIIERFGCRVISAEPVSELCDLIKRHPSLELHNVALGGTNQDIPINVFSGRCATILEPVASAESFTSRPIRMLTLAEFRKLGSAPRIDLLKVDIEGAEIELFNGSTDKQLNDIAQITVEFHDFLYRDQSEAVRQIKNRFADIGFWVLPFSRDNTNVLFLNRTVGISRAEITYLRTISKYGNGILRRLKRSTQSLGRQIEKH